MYREIFNYIIIGIFTCTFIAVCGCTLNSSVSSPAAIETANATADNILNSINSGNYSDYTRNFSDIMMTQVNESQFNYTRNVVQGTFGNYVSRGELTASVIQGYNVFVYNCTFSKGYVKFELAMNMTNTSRVEGVFFLKP